MDLQGKAALVTGGRRIGAVVATSLAARGADIALTFNRSKDDTERTAAEIRARGRQARALRADLADADACARAVDEAAAALGRLDVLVYMASVYAQTPFDDLGVAAWDRGLGVDLRSAFVCAKAAVRHMRAAAGGRIVTFADWIAASRRPRYRGYLPYYVAKSGVIALTEALALELAPDRILVNAVAPGPILAPEDTSDDERKAVEEATPLGRWGGPEEIAKVVLALVESDFITGETIRVDGGRHVR